MKKIKSLAIICLLITSLTVPTSALATSGYNYSQQNSFDSFLDSIFSFFFGNKEWDDEQENKYQKSFKYDGKNYYGWSWNWGWKKYSKKEWEDYFKKKYPEKAESIDYWRKWFCY